ncbi:MAG: hypothetical protein AB7D07_16705 [Desulfovibrionaceae bacterium]|jgi:hypothetical protein
MVQNLAFAAAFILAGLFVASLERTRVRRNLLALRPVRRKRRS